MGEIADMMLEGVLCEGCGVYLGEGGGYAQRCASCKRDERESNPLKTNCTICKKRIKVAGVKDHMRVVHGINKEGA